MYAGLAGLPAWTLAPFQALQRVLHAAARTVLDLKPHDRVKPVLQQLLGIHVPVAERIQYKFVLPGSQVASRGNLWTRKHNLHTRQSISLTYWHQLPMYLLVLDLHCVLRHRLAPSSCRGHVHESATGLYLSPHREHGTGCRHSWSCCGRPILFIAS